MADTFGYVVWAIHRLLPIILESALWLQEFALVRRETARLREQSRLLGHKLGMAWATSAEALRLRFELHHPDTVPALLGAADELEAIPFPFHSARVRRNAAQVMLVDGDLDGARRELRRAHDVFARLGAEHELRGTRSEMRALGMRLPARGVSEGACSLTGRELDIARLVARRLTNKEIATRLDISARTVSTHLSNMFGKLGVDSRGALVDTLREQPGFADDHCPRTASAPHSFRSSSRNCPRTSDVSETTIAPRSAGMNPRTEKPSPSVSDRRDVRRSIAPLITTRKSPSVRKMTGIEKSLITGFTIVLTTPKTSATAMSAIGGPENEMPSTKRAAT